MAPASSTHIVFSSLDSGPLSLSVFQFSHSISKIIRQSRVHISTFSLRCNPNTTPSSSPLRYLPYIQRSLIPFSSTLMYLCADFHFDGNNGTIYKWYILHIMCFIYINITERCFARSFLALNPTMLKCAKIKLDFHHKRKFI